MLFGNVAGYGEEDEEQYAVACPGCGASVLFDEEALEEGEVTCPHCGKTITFPLDEEEES